MLQVPCLMYCHKTCHSTAQPVRTTQIEASNGQKTAAVAAASPDGQPDANLPANRQHHSWQSSHVGGDGEAHRLEGLGRVICACPATATETRCAASHGATPVKLSQASWCWQSECMFPRDMPFGKPSAQPCLSLGSLKAKRGLGGVGGCCSVLRPKCAQGCVCNCRRSQHLLLSMHIPVVLASAGNSGAVVGVAGVKMTSHASNARLKWLITRARMRCKHNTTQHNR